MLLPCVVLVSRSHATIYGAKGCLHMVVAVFASSALWLLARPYPIFFSAPSLLPSHHQHRHSHTISLSHTLSRVFFLNFFPNCFFLFSIMSGRQLMRLRRTLSTPCRHSSSRSSPAAAGDRGAPAEASSGGPPAAGTALLRQLWQSQPSAHHAQPLVLPPGIAPHTIHRHQPPLLPAAADRLSRTVLACWPDQPQRCVDGG